MVEETYRCNIGIGFNQLMTVQMKGEPARQTDRLTRKTGPEGVEENGSQPQ